jgi:hypothetical protein
MGRKSSGPPARSHARHAPAPAPQRQSAPPPATAPHHSAPAPSGGGGGGMLAGLGATMAQGFAFGTGSAIAREAVGAAMGAFSGGEKTPAPQAPVQQPMQQQQSYKSDGPCALDQNSFTQCLQQNAGNSGACDFYYSALQSCQSANKF